MIIEADAIFVLLSIYWAEDALAMRTEFIVGTARHGKGLGT